MKKIIVLVRTRNEEKNIERFCDAYEDADKIIVADGGSGDDTVNLALSYPNVLVCGFNEYTEMENGLWRNPAGEHINFLIDTALELSPDWLIFDDADCVPNKHLRYDLRKILERSVHDLFHVVRLFLWGDDQHFPNLAQPGGKGIWAAGLYAWKPSTNIRFKTNPVNHTHEFVVRPDPRSTFHLQPPYCLMHRPWATEDEVKRKMDFYKNSGQHPTIMHPLNFGGSPQELPEWAIE